MTVHFPERSVGLDPLIAEAKRRMRRRRYLVGLAVAAAAVGAAVGVYDLGSHQGGGTTGSPPAKPSLRQYESRHWSVRYPLGLHVEESCWCGTYGWPIYETTFANFLPTRGEQQRGGLGNLYEPPPQGSRTFPANGVALRVVSQSPFAPPRGTTLPLRLSSFRVAPRAWYPRIRPRPLLHELRAGQNFLVEVWIGRKVSARQRALLARMVASLSVPSVRPFSSRR